LHADLNEKKDLEYVKKNIAAILLLANFFWAFSAFADASLSDKIDQSADSSSNGSISSGLNQSNSGIMDENANAGASEDIKKAQVATYVYNDDDDSLDVSLYIDSVPKGKTDVSKGGEETFGNFTVKQGIHRFKIIWKDEDTNEVYESEIKKEIFGDDVISLYTTGHEEPEEYDLTVSVKNENGKSTNAYLYIDGIYEDNQEISEESTDDFSSASAEEGIHDISLRWLDPYTNDQYEKKKRITIEGDSAVVFVISKGTSFQDLGLAKGPGEETEISEISSFSSGSKSSAKSTADRLEDAGGMGENSSGNSDLNGVGNSSANDDGILDGVGTASINEETQTDPTNEKHSTFRTLSATDSSSADDAGLGKSGWTQVSVVYPLVLFAAAYLVFRH
jgi:hypothetical protein